MTTPQNLDERFRDAVSAMQPPASLRALDESVRDGVTLTGQRAGELFDAQLTSRHLDLAARWLRSFHEGFHTVGSSGHEGNAAVAAALRVDDPALLHYRSTAFQCVRAVQAAPAAVAPDPMADDPGVVTDPLVEVARDVLRGVVASSRDPVTGGRHKVTGRPDLHVIPSTGAAGSHLPRAVGVAFGLTRAALLRDAHSPWPDDAVVACSFGDGAVSHASATAALNTAGWYDHSGVRLPLLLICEDNGLGLSVAAPDGWLAATLRSRPGIRYTAADGCDLAATHAAAVEAVAWVREHRRPAVLHLSVVRLMGHSGADLETTYRDAGDIARDLERDPLVGTARLLVESGVASPDELIARYDEIGWRVRKVAEEVLAEPKLANSAEVVAPLAPRRPLRAARTIAEAAERAGGAGANARARVFAGRLPESAGPLTLAQTINATLTDALLAHPNAVLFGADVAAKGGVHDVTVHLRERFGAERVFDTPRDETSVLGLALGAGPAGLLPVPEIQYLAYLHSGEDQLRGEAATLPFFTAGALRNPMVVRVAGLAHQQALGGHLHNENSVAVLRDLPGVVVAVPARPGDAAPMLRSCLAAAANDGSVCVFLEPVGLYHTRDLYQKDDGGWLASYAPPAQWTGEHVPIGRARTYLIGADADAPAEDLTIVTFGNGVRMSLRVAARLAAEGYGCRVVDLRWLAPLPAADLVREASATSRVLIVDETRRTGGVGEGILAALVDGGYVGSARRIASADSFIPLGPAAQRVLIGEDAITQGAYALLAG